MRLHFKTGTRSKFKHSSKQHAENIHRGVEMLLYVCVLLVGIFFNDLIG